MKTYQALIRGRMVWYGMVWWHGMVHVWYGTVWYDIPLLAMLDNQSEPSFKQNKLQVLSGTEVET